MRQKHTDSFLMLKLRNDIDKMANNDICHDNNLQQLQQQQQRHISRVKTCHKLPANTIAALEDAVASAAAIEQAEEDHNFSTF